MLHWHAQAARSTKGGSSRRSRSERGLGRDASPSTSSFTSYHGQLLSLAVQWGVAIEIERAIKKSASFC